MLDGMGVGATGSSRLLNGAQPPVTTALTTTAATKASDLDATQVIKLLRRLAPTFGLQRARARHARRRCGPRQPPARELADL